MCRRTGCANGLINLTAWRVSVLTADNCWVGRRAGTGTGLALWVPTAMLAT